MAKKFFHKDLEKLEKLTASLLKKLLERKPFQKRLDRKPRQQRGRRAKPAQRLRINGCA